MIDLHTHSSCSDGSDSPAAVVEGAAAAGCTSVALTDHDTTEGLAEATRRAAEAGIRLVRGCEVSCTFSPGSMHMLCYFLEAAECPLEQELARLRTDRTTRNERLATLLAQLGLPITYEEVLAEAGGAGVGRPHFAAVLVAKGVVGSIDEAFKRYLAKGTPGYVSKARIDGATIVDLARRSGAVAVLAHPHSLGLDGRALANELGRLAEAGLGGVECYYGRYTPDERRDLVSLAQHCGLVATGGSDFHGSYKPDLSIGVGLGDLDVPDEALEQLEDRRP